MCAALPQWGKLWYTHHNDLMVDALISCVIRLGQVLEDEGAKRSAAIRPAKYPRRHKSPLTEGYPMMKGANLPMKRILILVCALMLAIPAFAEETAEPTPSPTPNSIVEGYVAPVAATPIPTPELPPLRDDPVLTHMVEIAQRIDLLAENGMFRRFFIPASIPESAIEAVSYGAHARPVRVFHLSGQALIDALYAGADQAQRLDFARPELMRDLVEELPELLWGRRSDEELHLLNVFSRYKVFAARGAYGCGVFFMLYEDAAPVMIAWMAENDCMRMAAFFMPDETLAAVTDTQGLSAWFAGMGMPPVTFEEVPLT